MLVYYLGYSPVTFALTMCISHFTLLHPLLCVYVSRKQGPEIPFGFPRNITTSCQGLVALCVMAPFSKVPWNTLMEQISKVRALGIHICWLDMAGVGVFLSKEVKVLWLTHIWKMVVFVLLRLGDWIIWMFCQNRQWASLTFLKFRRVDQNRLFIGIAVLVSPMGWPVKPCKTSGMQANQYNTPAKKIKSKSSELETVSELQLKNMVWIMDLSKQMISLLKIHG